MHPAKKRKVMDDLDDFRNSKDYYRHVGKAWKRGYLLHGPPGTGKSTLVAAMANYLNCDIYDIELTMVQTNNDLRKLFIETKGKSIIVIEDIDCSLDLTGQRSSAVTLSGLLNFIDGLWSAHSGERIIVFTTNFIDKLDPALIRGGRMEVHVGMSYCCYEAFLTLDKNYLDLDAHPLFDAVRGLLGTLEITHADVAECLMTSKRTDRCADACLGRLVDELKTKGAAQLEERRKKKEAEESKEPAAGAVADANAPLDKDKSAKGGRRVIDPRSIRRRMKVEDKTKKKLTSRVVAKPSGTEEAVATGITGSAGLDSNGGGAVNLIDNIISRDSAKDRVGAGTDVMRNVDTEAMVLDGGSTAGTEGPSDYGGSEHGAYDMDNDDDDISDDSDDDDDIDDSEFDDY